MKKGDLVEITWVDSGFEYGEQRTGRLAVQTTVGYYLEKSRDHGFDFIALSMSRDESGGHHDVCSIPVVNIRRKRKLTP